MENEELLNKIMDISIAIARIQTQLTSQEKMLQNEFTLIQREQMSVMNKVEDMDKDIKIIQKDSKIELERKYNEAKVEFEKVYSKMELRIKELEKRVDLNERFKLKIMVAIGLVGGGVAFGGQLVKLVMALAS